ncbi:DNA replication/repair protein RecF [Desertibacillus haloalkaliphilus]|uniref:DNA replication/repair protein RecF n=1 Tax=Desertibacillus haloalkaliphilus TaxID=1328930 RepID=UPI001C27C5D5|nr:DNA replication/repair protein RecF [Desertibacillus haloalkaliphilus]MBU8905754.1 DNA replication/repair protein RecF [Desertibacillus haloalkaliphilus]
MHIKELQLANYRNYGQTSIKFDNKVNLILGENAQGKTNVMEAIYVLAMAKSHRTSRDKDLISWDREYGKIEGRVEKRSGSLSLSVIISSKGKKVKLNALEQRKLSEYIGAFNVVMFAPEDLNLVKGSPQVRRRFIDMEIGQINPVYLYHLGIYNKVLKQRNHLLKDLYKNRQNEAMLDVLTTQLVTAAANVVKRRFEFLQRLQSWAEQIHFDISRGKEKLILQYKPSFNVSEEMDLTNIEEELFTAFEGVKDKEIRRGTSLVGPHRDDVGFTVNGKDVQTFGSQGQQRTTALSLKLAEIELIHSKVGEYPILLLDDVLSELDDYRQSHLLNTIQGKIQTFVTTTSVDGIDHETLDQAATYLVKQGEINKVK